MTDYYDDDDDSFGYEYYASCFLVCGAFIILDRPTNISEAFTEFVCK
jgi:hypothetical protein